MHVTFPGYYSPRNMGLLDPATSDGRVIFFLPWQGNTIAGTTDTKARVEMDPKPYEEDIRWILEEVRRYLIFRSAVGTCSMHSLACDRLCSTRMHKRKAPRVL